jgi:hypothetical protein
MTETISEILFWKEPEYEKKISEKSESADAGRGMGGADPSDSGDSGAHSAEVKPKVRPN